LYDLRKETAWSELKFLNVSEQQPKPKINLPYCSEYSVLVPYSNHIFFNQNN
jgi:hypothetical protein